jgi:molybdate transport system permease protein
MSGEAWQIIWFTAWVSALATLLIIPPGLALAWLLARRDWRGKSIVETLVSLPLVIPPVATGLILLKLSGKRGPIGSFLYEKLGVEIIFTWKAVLISLAVMSFPLFVRSARAAIEGVNPRLEQIARTLGASGWRVFFTITAPLALRGILAGVLLAFARALGEFGATIMVAGNIAGETTTLSLSIYQSVQLGQDSEAWTMLGFSIVLAFAAVWGSELLLRREKEKRS